MPATDKVEKYKERLNELDQAIFASIKTYGECLIEAKANLSANEWDELWAWLKIHHKVAELDAMLAVGSGDLAAELFPDGCTHSKVLRLSREDQQRLLSGERLQIYSDDNAAITHERSWVEMTRDQRNRLLSAKSGRILTLSEQTPPPPEGKTAIKKVELYVTSSYHHGDGYVTMRNGYREGRIDLSAIRSSMPRESFEELLRDLRG
jgi:hypothetical protein